jgi:hypothetical protein
MLDTYSYGYTLIIHIFYIQWDGPVPHLLNGLQVTVPAGHPQKIIECREELGGNSVRALAQVSPILNDC